MSDADRPLTPDETARVVELALHFAREGMTVELAGFVDHGLPVDVRDENGNTPLMLAAYHGHADTVRMLVELGADVDQRNGRDQSPVAGADLDAGTPSARQTARMFEREDLLG